jgi:hypothetical protein
MKSLLEITSCILHDCGMLCGVNPTRDLLEITWRVEHEGESFLTITLPSLSQSLERALEVGCWSSTHAPAFSRRSRGSLPRFLGGFFDHVFNRDGTIRQWSDHSASNVWAIRQICRAVSKLFTVASPERNARAIDHFIDVEKEIRSHASCDKFADIFCKVSAIVWDDILCGGTDQSRYSEYRPRHGRGTTSEAIVGNDKYRFRTWPLRLEREFPFTEFGVSNILNSESEDLLSSLEYLLPRNEIPVRVVPVPKTARTPRIIAIEPVAMQFAQQAISDWVRPRIESRSRFTSGHVNFTDQKVNNQFAKTSSVDGRFATIDMSDASDRVSCKHVAMMLKTCPAFSRQVFSTRSTRALLPGRSVSIPLRKFASMGSAMCFPVEAMVFFITCVSSVLHRSGLVPSSRTVLSASRGIYVYGDDIVVPVKMAPSVVEDLESFGFKVNAAKSFWIGKFRESCGGDYYGGIDVTPVYCRRKLPNHRADVKGIVSAVAFANQLYWAGLWKTAKMVRSAVEKIAGVLPSVAVDDQILGWQSVSNAQSYQAWSADYQRPKRRGLVVVPGRRVDHLDGDSALLKCLRLIGIPANDVYHLQSSVRYGNLALKRRWI